MHQDRGISAFNRRSPLLRSSLQKLMLVENAKGGLPGQRLHSTTKAQKCRCDTKQLTHVFRTPRASAIKSSLWKAKEGRKADSEKAQEKSRLGRQEKERR